MNRCGYCSGLSVPKGGFCYGNWARLIAMDEVHETREIRRATDRSGRRIVNQYTFLRKLGEGAYGKVKLAECNHRHYAIKIINKDRLRRQREFVVNPKGGMGVRNALQDILREIAIMKKLQHENVVRLHEVIDDEEREKLYLGMCYAVLDFCGKGAILDWDSNEKRFVCPFDSSSSREAAVDELSLRVHFRQMLSGLQYCKSHPVHSNHIIHRDIKPQNVLVTEDGVVKIADFGQAIIFDADDTQQKTAGTLHFFPPESCGPEKTRFSGKAADIWALGLTLYALVYRKLPFAAGESFAEIIEAINAFELTFPAVPPITSMLKSVLCRMLDKNPTTRVKTAELMADPWVNCESPLLRPRSKMPPEVSPADLNDAVISIGDVIFIVLSTQKPLHRRREK